MTLFLNSSIFIFGLIIGSFLNCLIYRQEMGKNMKGRSFCPNCSHTLYWKDLIPVLSFVLLKGKCRYCKEKISWQYPIVEISTGLIFLLIFNEFLTRLPDGQVFNFQNIIDLTYLLIVAGFLIVVFVFDLKHFIIPDNIIFPLIIIALAYSLLFFSLSSILAGIGAILFFLIIFLISKGAWLGFGDVKLALFMGLFLGWPNIIVAMFFAFWSGAVIGLALIAMKKKTIKSEVPFGPFLIAGVFFAFFWGNSIINWYFNLII